MEKKQCIVIAGPTAVGKTALSLKLAHSLNGAIVSADSMQVYKGMNIGSAKLRPDEMEDIPHYLIDCLEPTEEFNVVRFQQMAREAMDDIYSKGMLPIITGGTGFYIQALINDIDFTETGNVPSLRSEYERIAAEKGPEALHGILRTKDEKAAREIHFNDVKRVIRALEFFDETGSTISSHNEQQREKKSPFTCGYFVVSDDRPLLYERINKRVDEMMEAGLEKEVRELYESGLTPEHTSMKGIGYREFFPYFNGEKTLDEVVDKIKQDTRHFAKRQITWFKREKEAIWFDRQDYENNTQKIADAMLLEWRMITNNK